MVEIDQYSVPFVFEEFEELLNVRFFNTHVVGAVFQDGLNFGWREVGQIAHFLDLCLDRDGFAAIFEVNGIRG